MNKIKRVIPREIKDFMKSLRQRIIMFQYRGDQVQCPICNTHFKYFGAYGTKQRPNARCLKCGSLERQRLQWLYINERTDFFTRGPLKLLHIAPERCFYEKLSTLSHVEYYPYDLFPEYYPYKKIFKMDITDIQFENNFFDIILCNHVLEHVPEDEKAMKEFYRVMKNGGWGIFQVPIDYSRDQTYEDFSITQPQERFIAFGQEDHVRWYGKDYKNRLESAHFKVTEDDWVKKLSQKIIERYRLTPTELIYFCQK